MNTNCKQHNIYWKVGIIFYISYIFYIFLVYNVVFTNPKANCSHNMHLKQIYNKIIYSQTFIYPTVIKMGMFPSKSLKNTKRDREEN